MWGVVTPEEALAKIEKQRKEISNLLNGIEVRLNTDYLENKYEFDSLANKIA